GEDHQHPGDEGRLGSGRIMESDRLKNKSEIDQKPEEKSFPDDGPVHSPDRRKGERKETEGGGGEAEGDQKKGREIGERPLHHHEGAGPNEGHPEEEPLGAPPRG